MRPILSPQTNLTRIAAATLMAAALLSACGKKDAGAGAGGPGGQMPAPEVGVITTHKTTVALQTELPGRVDAIRTAQVRARVNGVVLKRLFTEGSEVKAGQPLFRIDPAPYEAALQSAQAQLARAQANLTQASTQAERYKPLVEANAVSKQEYTNVVATAKQAEADVAAGKAAVRTAQINTGYTTVTAPISGRIGRALVTEGALVSATESTQLATIQQLDSVYVNVTQSATELQQLRRAAGLQLKTAQSIPVTVLLDDGTALPNKGKLLFSDVSVDPTSGQVLLRAEVQNPGGLLLPGQYVRVRLSQADLPGAILVPQQAVTRSDKGDSVFVVGADNKPVPRPIKVGQQQGTSWVVLSGLNEGERVVVDGFQKMMMMQGAPVKAVPWTGNTTSAAPQGTGAGGTAGG
ncbi:efflux RND transporter periplasmic adaptor subunit, partial [Zemynaea arenosa]